MLPSQRLTAPLLKVLRATLRKCGVCSFSFVGFRCDAFPNFRFSNLLGTLSSRKIRLLRAMVLTQVSLEKPALSAIVSISKPINSSTVCTHLGCVVPWSAAANKFQCPCHGSQVRWIVYEFPFCFPYVRTQFLLFSTLRPVPLCADQPLFLWLLPTVMSMKLTRLSSARGLRSISVPTRRDGGTRLLALPKLRTIVSLKE